MLLRVEGERAFASAALDAELGRSGLDARDRGLATDLVYGVLRWASALDRRIDEVSRRPVASLDPVVRGSLRLGAYQLLGPSPAPPHAAVGEAVELTRTRRGKTLAGYANGVLRGLARREPRPLDPRESIPGWLADALAARLPAEEVQAFAASSVAQPWLGLRAERHRASREDLLARLRREAPDADLRPGSLSALALRTRGLGDPRALGAYREGWTTVQDEGAQAATLLLDVDPGHRVLDACAGRGGKTSLLAGLARGAAAIDAADRHPGKLARLAADLERLGLPPVRTVAVDLEVGSAGLEPPYDRILVDVPCSGTGTIARRPELRWRVGPAEVAVVATAQQRIARRCASLLAPGGVLVYVACSVLAEEGPDQIGALLASDEGRSLRIDRELELWPHRDETDGFYAARLLRPGGTHP